MGNLSIKQKLTELIQKRISFEVSQDKLLIKGDLGALNDEDKQFLKENKKDIISLIENQTQEIPLVQKLDKSISKPLSFSQQSLWLLDKINNGSHHYNLSSAFKLTGKVNYKALDQTFLTILQRHESLRSYFLVDQSGEPIQKVQTITDFQSTIEELDALSENYELDIAQKIEEEACKVFDLTKDMLLNVRLLKLKREEHILIVTMHHIASDGWSMGILINEFNTLYSSYVKGEPNPLPKLNIQYADYAYWQRQWLTGKVLDEQINYWKNQLSDLPVVHSLPLDKPRPVMQSFNGKTYNSHIHKNVLKSLYDLCRSESASLFMGIHAAFSVLLARYSNEKDIVVGTPIANREQAETSDLVGFFMNLLVLRSDLSQKPSFVELLRQSKKMLEGAYEHQQMPFEKLVEKLEVKRNLSHNPLFQVLLTLHNTQEVEFSLPEVVMEPVNNDNESSAKYDFSLNIREDSEGLHLSWEYNTDLFEESTIILMTEHFETLLISLLDTPNENVFKTNMINEIEERNIYKHLQGEIVEISKDDSVIESFDYQVKNLPNETAIICNDISYSYKELGEKVDSITCLLLDQGVQNGDHVGICVLRNVEMVATIFACFRVGAVYIPLDPVYSSERRNQIILDAQLKCIVTLKPLSELYLKEVSNEVFVYLDQQKFQENRKVVPNYNDSNVAYIIFTSGTTGKPKGIEVTHKNLNNLLKGLDISFGNQTQQKWLAQTSMNFDISVLELIWTISRGQTIVLQQSSPFKLLSPDKLSPAKEIDFSVMFFGADKNDDKYEVLLETAKFADKNDFSAIWTPERHFGEFGGAFASPSVLGSALSVLTQNISIRAGSVVLPLHDPISIAEEWSIVDNLSNGRVGVSIASGWHPNDFVISNSDYNNRRQEMRNRVAELKALWKGEPVIRKNGVDKDFTIKIRPTPIQKELPIWITAAGNPETFRYAGEIGANILTHMLGQSQEELEKNIKTYHKALIDNGFNIEDKKVSLMLHTYIDSSENAALEISKKPFKEYLGSSIKLMEPIAQELGLDVHTQSEELIEMAYQKFSKENTLFGSPESCQKMLFSIQNIGVTEVACLVDFGVESEKVLSGLEKIVETKNIYRSYTELNKLLHTDNQKTELDLIHDYKVTHVQMTPSQSKLVVDLYNQTQNKDLSSVQHWLIGGEAIQQDLVKGLSSVINSNCRLYNMYGPTETTVWSAWRQINTKDINIGNPIINTEVLLLNEYEQQVPLGMIGEFCIGGFGVAKGYYNNPELTNKNFKSINNPYFDNNRFYKTGDLMKLNANGTFEYIGRRDNQIKISGYRIELEEIEKAISNVSGVKDCKVVPIIKDNETFLSAYVVKEDIVYGEYENLPVEKQAKPFHFTDGSTVYHQSDRQLAMLYQEIIEDGIYFKHGISIPENGLVLDIGANIGTFSIDVNQRQPNATIIAFEPIPQIFSALKKNFEHRQIKGRVMNYGVSNKKERATFYYYPEMAGMSGRFADKETILSAIEKYIEHDKEILDQGANNIAEEKQKIAQSLYENIDGPDGLSEEFKQYLSSLYVSEEVDCQLTTVSDIIDELNIQTIDLLKLDVEKSECLVLDGIRSEHWSMIRHLAVEVDGDNNLDSITKLLHKNGYVINVEELIMSDTNVPKEENTYMLYATNHNHGIKQNDTVIEQLQAQTNEDTIINTLKRKLPEYMNPRDIVFVPSIPLMENGKVDMVRLKEFKPQKVASNDIPQLTNKMELDIYRIWCEVLNKENIPSHISIFEAGGNSIKIVLLHEKLQTEFNVKFSLIELFRNTTIPQQAKLIQNTNNQEDTNTIKKAVNKGALRRNARANKVN
ncbi:MupA/Atu3671 family FMN-dependent luciferase-like monooxygenase [Aquimarina sediminis]|uniref:MupA/Atu3671 family FMN-dependent luciferase-like monooxygenase n=1 Tax=Aquimarina sediminis TaxID=2070536 RepID=UPI000CA04B91|nr:MupA/Atu3671 family FMN-dependent luciferase-like monooxygenase [Aquimarina sediminis]